MVLLMVITVAYLPIVLRLLLQGVTVNPVKIAQSLVLLMLLPLAIGLFVKARYDATAARVKPPLDWLSNVSLILLIVLITVVNFDKVLQVFGAGGILAGASVHRAWILHRLDAWGSRQRYTASAGTSDSTAQYCSCTCGRKPKF